MLEGGSKHSLYSGSVGVGKYTVVYDFLTLYPSLQVDKNNQHWVPQVNKSCQDMEVSLQRVMSVS